MNRHQIKKALAAATAKLATRQAAKEGAHMRGDVAGFEAAERHVREAEAEVNSLTRALALGRRAAVDSCTAGLISNNVD